MKYNGAGYLPCNGYVPCQVLLSSFFIIISSLQWICSLSGNYGDQDKDLFMDLFVSLNKLPPLEMERCL